MRRIALVLTLLVPAACTEPHTLFLEGNVTSVFVIKDVFQSTETLQMRIVKDPANLCQQMDVTVTASTWIYKAGSPATKLTLDALKHAGVVRVPVGAPAADVCPVDVEATSIAIVK